MSADHPTPDTAHARAAKTAVLLVNLGSPDAPTPMAIRRYLRQFLSDRRVVELPRLLWLTILYGFVLPLRPQKLAHAYAKVWTEQGSPLLAISRQQQAALAQQLGPNTVVALAMSYGNPAIPDTLAELEAQNVRRLLVLPLYPQYSATTTASVFDNVFAALSRQRWMPELRTIGSYHDDANYIAALANSLRSHWNTQPRAEHLLISFHSIPRQCVLAGDPYYCHCQKTARLLAEALQLEPDRWSIAFQSRLGNQPWLQPYTDIVIPQLAGRGVSTLDVICPGFSADCLETLEEVALRYAEDFREAGGKSLTYVPALNDAPEHIEALALLARRHLQDWPAPLESEELIQQRQRRASACEAAMVSETLLV